MVMRQVYSDTDMLAWHRNAMLGILGDDFDVNHPEDPQCGWFKRKLVKHGPWVPAKIWLCQVIEDGCLVNDSKFQAEVNGKYADAEREWSWLCGNPITEAEFNYLTAACQWSRDYAPDEPMANPKEKVDWLRVPVPTF
jgi:hypothetical protein